MHETKKLLIPHSPTTESKGLRANYTYLTPFSIRKGEVKFTDIKRTSGITVITLSQMTE
jgi:hypothetical protein